MPAIAQPQAPLEAAYVVMGPDGAAIARVVTTNTACPTLTTDGVPREMHVRAVPATEPLRPTQSRPDKSKPSAFPALTCEATIPNGAHSARIGGQTIPVPRKDARRIVVIGDTGCRLKASENAYQACNDPKQYRFAAIAAKAAAWKPDLVVHVGDYLYRENPCPAGNTGCAGTAWGYGWDAWNADFFAPAAPLLQAAPWIVVRGNHENCSRAGQGWWRFLDPRRLETTRDCNDPAQDQIGDTSAPYAIPIGGSAQIIVLDLAISGTKPIGQDDYRFTPFRDSYVELDRLVGQASYNIVAGHKPILAISGGEKPGTLDGGTGGIQSVFQTLNPLLLPAGVDVLLSGHVHVWEQLSFSSPHPTQFITGFSGTQEDRVPLPAKPPANVAPGPGAIVDAFSSWVDGFGYMTMERKGPTSWKVKVWSVDSKVVNRCQIEGRRSSCRYAQVDTAIH
ncbi:metallophosphoesterase family protein [Sphingomonas sp. H39-1-10]|uniref:metallophosphoesterase family protein n=1 Tax=Sphingomonas pollutisoli TaxID=3030829 RepID=UPI0023B95758|nr:metallophosphoesterase family protein [Sphingomonas pollutisoli]MDF0491377.1 metallophosphoesterase family protein [Sphingomonas pollutisoli]